MNFNLSAAEIAEILNKTGKVDLSVPESKRQQVLNNPSLKFYLDSIEKTAAKHRGSVIPSVPYSLFKLYYENGNRNEFQFSEKGGYFPRRERLAAFALSAWLYEKEEDLKELHDIIWAVCDEYTWALPPHLIVNDKDNSFINRLEDGDYTVDLFSAETSETLAEILMLLGDKIPPIIKKRVNHLLNERVLKRVLSNDYWWMSAENNWAAVCAGNIGIAAIYTYTDTEDNELLAKIINRLLPSFEAYLKGIPEDGGCLEGIKYWDYGFGYYVYFAELLYRRTHGAIDLLSDSKVQKIAEFQQKCYFKGGRCVSFADSSSYMNFHLGLASFLSRKFNSVFMPPTEAAGDFNMDVCYRFAANLRDLIWTDKLENEDNIKYYILPCSEIFIASSKNGVGIAAKGGNNNEPHNHNDVGSFQIFKNGEEILCDLGSMEYTRDSGLPEFRYKILGHGSQGHNLPIIDGETQKFGAEYKASKVTINDEGIEADIAPAYGINKLSKLLRKISFNSENGETKICDSFEFTDKNHEITERFITYGEIGIDKDKGRVKISVGTEALYICYDKSKFSVEINTESFVNTYGEIKKVRLLDFNAKGEESFEVEFIISHQ